MSYLEIVPFNKENGVLGDDEVFFVVVFDFDGVLLEEKGEVAGFDLQGHIVGVVVGAVPRFAFVERGQGIAWAAFEDIA